MMIQFSTLTQPTPAPDLPRRVAASPKVFTQSLASFLDRRHEDAVPHESGAGRAKGKDDAAPGKPLPDERDRDDAALAWLATMTPVQAPSPPTPPAGVAGGQNPLPVVVGAGTDTAPPAALDGVEGQVSPVGFDVAQPERKLGGFITLASDPISATIDGTAKDLTGTSTIRNLEPDAKHVIQSAPNVSEEAFAMVAAPAPPATVTAAQVFGAAMREVERHEAKRPDDNITTLPIPPAQVEAQLHAVAATGDAQQAPLDMGHERWPHRMIERIETLRDAADATDTRIRLVPDALGAIDVSVRRDGDAVHVHFAAEQAATRALLTDAQPRLAELAEARGLKLGGTAVDSGGANARQDRPAPPAPVSLPQAPARVAAMPTPDDDARIA